MRRYLVVGNQTLSGGQLLRKVGECIGEGPCSFHIVVPATPQQGTWTYTEGEAHQVALERLKEAISRFSELVAEVDGEVGDPRPLDAIRDAFLARRFDAILLSTLPRGASRWLKMDLPARVRAEFGVPVTHVIGGAELLNGLELRRSRFTSGRAARQPEGLG